MTNFAQTHTTFEPHGAQVTQVRNDIHVVTTDDAFGAPVVPPAPATPNAVVTTDATGATTYAAGTTGQVMMMVGGVPTFVNRSGTVSVVPTQAAAATLTAAWTALETGNIVKVLDDGSADPISKTYIWSGTALVDVSIDPRFLDDLTDVVITSPTSGQTLIFNGTNWVNVEKETQAVIIDAVTTTSSSPIVGQTIPITNPVTIIECRAVCTKSAGAGVSAIGAACAIVRTLKVKNVAGVVSLGIVQNDYTDNETAGTNLAFAVSGSNVTILVVGTASNTQDWVLTTIVTN